MRTFFAGFIGMVVVLCTGQYANATLRLPQLVSDGMVLQRNTNIKIWGWGSPGERVKIAFIGKSFKTLVGDDGQWSVTLPKIKAGGPYQMDIDGSNHIVLKDVLIGDVWFCSGQSNMTIKMERVKEKYPEEIAKADFPLIRYFFVATTADVAGIHSDYPPGHWVATTKQNILEIGAVAYFFAKQLYSRHHIPIGIINSSVGGTPIQAWIGESGIKDIGTYGHRLAQFKDTAFMAGIARAKQRAIAPDPALQGEDKGTSGAIKWYEPSYIPNNWHKFWMPGYWADQGVKGLNGVVWFRKEVNVPVEMAGKAAKLFLGRIIDADETYVNGKLVGKITYQYPPRRYEVPAGILKAGKNVIMVRVTNSAGKGGFVPDKRYELTDGTTVIDLRGDWLYQVGQAYQPRRNALRGSAPFSAQDEPTGLYNAMIAPAVSYPVKGFLWYQGETNIGTKNYGELLTALINNWRTAWKDDSLPFLVVQLPNFGEVQYSPAESAWAEIREAQLKAMALPNTALAVAIDGGEWNDIHPLNKKDVGERLALAAERLAYGNLQVVASGPTFQSAVVYGNSITLAFTDIGTGLVSNNGEPLAQFAIAGEDKQFVWASATIVGDKVVVSSPLVQHPLYVRYAWADNPEGANLYNREGLPASPFRTDLPK
ncbi:sialate O-acetylesterase [Mucilaginibacter psychrotolerans]|uniref:Sialate O-acetylesterase n=1 Tax=Mucilaginibacter psychrotolerans TaxID=1524096 RepID=A0A4Y8SGE1_9SPHI|nr:sialate O-acetylesterase [Mucilaginibacter psychrotolerans]TFF37524.1 sialate O-acetylesterase [Mucilaginibacter psychrotolerans]